VTTQRLPTHSFGPFLKGVVESANRQLALDGALRFARNARFDGVGRLKTRDGDEVALTLMDDGEDYDFEYGADPTPVTSVIAVKPFGDGAIAVAHSTRTHRVYVYRLTADMDDWYDDYGVLQGTLFPEPAGVLWTGVAEPPVVTIAEGLGIAYIAHNAALDASAISYPTKTYEDPGIVSTLMADLDGLGAKPVAFLGVAAYNQHLIGFGFDKTNVAATAFRPEKIRHSAPSFGGLAGPGSGSFDVGHAVRSARERITGVFVAGEVCYFGLNFGLWAMAGFGRDSFQKKSLSSEVGIAGVLAACEGPNGWLYGWSHKGPIRVLGMSEPEELGDAIQDTVSAIASPNRVIAAYDQERDQVCFFYDSNGVRNKFASFDHTRNAWLGPDSELGVAIACASRISPVYGAAVAGSPPAGPPTTPSTTAIGTSNATANWVNGDAVAGTRTRIEVRRQGATAWTLVTHVGAGVTSATITGLEASKAYEWRAAHVRNGQTSTYLGPSAGTQFTTTASSGGGGGGGGGSGTMTGPSNLTLTDYTFFAGSGSVYIQWNNSGESGALTEIYRAGPSLSAPAAEDYELLTTIGEGLSAYMDTVPLSGTWWYKIRHVRGADSSALSAASSIAMTL
jgi:hypothetical protein